MRLNDFDLKGIRPDELIESISDKSLQFSKQEIKSLQRIIVESVEKSYIKSAINAIILSVVVDDRTTFDTLRRNRCLRYSTYLGKKCVVPEIVGSLIQYLNVLNYDNKDNIDFLGSVFLMAPTLKVFKDLNSKILVEIRRFNKRFSDRSLIKTLMSYNDYLFLTGHEISDPDISGRLIGNTKEDIALAVSLIIFMISNYRALDERDERRVSDEYIVSRDIESMVINACRIIDLKEIEIKIAHFNFTAKKTGDKNFSILGPTENFEKSISLGFIRSEMQYNNDIMHMANDPEALAANSIEDVARQLHVLSEHKLFELKEDLYYLRYALKIPKSVMLVIIDNFITPDTFFKEDYFYLSHAFKEQMIDLDLITNLKIRGELTVLDFLKIQRFFVLLQHLFSREMLKQGMASNVLIYRSIIPVFTEDQMYDILEMFTTTEKAENFLDIVSWESSDDKLLDIQYHPFVFVHSYYLASLSVFARSNILRNLYATEYKRQNANMVSDGQNDPITELLKRAFIKKGFQCDSEIKYKQLTDIDFITRMEDTLIVFECKQAILPTSIHDLRTIYDYIKKAERQLNIIGDAFENGELMPQISSKTSVNLLGINKLITGIIISNRMFVGNEFEYPVRNINEIVHLISQGVVTTSEGVFKIWKGEEFSLIDLEDYLYRNDILKVMYDSLEKITLQYDFANMFITENMYSLPVESSREKLARLTANYKKLS